MGKIDQGIISNSQKALQEPVIGPDLDLLTFHYFHEQIIVGSSGIPKYFELTQKNMIESGTLFQNPIRSVFNIRFQINKPSRKTPLSLRGQLQQEYFQLIGMKTKDHTVNG